MKNILLSSFLVLSASFLRGQSAHQADSVTSKKSDTITFTKVDIESEFPGGAKAWNAFLSENLVYPKKAARKKIEGQVVVQFIVGKDGSLSDISIISGPEELWPAVMHAIEKSPSWIPAVQNGRKVKSYKRQPINFKIPD